MSKNVTSTLNPYNYDENPDFTYYERSWLYGLQ